jgi:hypothetical protein
MASTPVGPFERCAPEWADHRCARRGPDRREDTDRVAGSAYSLAAPRVDSADRGLPVTLVGCGSPGLAQLAGIRP